jgi:methyl-accepting chemotaxis protein
VANDAQSSLENTVQRADAISRTFRQSAGRTEALERAVGELLSEHNELDEMLSAVESVVTSIEETNATVQKLGRAQQEVRDLAGETLHGLQASASGLQEMTASIASISKDTSQLATSAESNAATLEEVARSIRGVASNATDLGAASEQLSAAARETSISVADVAARGEGNATALQQVAATVEEMAKGIARASSASRKTRAR